MISHHPRCLLTPDLETQRTPTFTNKLPDLRARSLPQLRVCPRQKTDHLKPDSSICHWAAVTTKDLKLGSSQLPLLRAPVSDLHIFNILKIKLFSPLALLSLSQGSLSVSWCPAWINKRNPFYVFYKALLQLLFPLPWEISIILAEIKNQRLTTLNTLQE